MCGKHFVFSEQTCVHEHNVFDRSIVLHKSVAFNNKSYPSNIMLSANTLELGIRFTRLNYLLDKRYGIRQQCGVRKMIVCVVICHKHKLSTHIRNAHHLYLETTIVGSWWRLLHAEFKMHTQESDTFRPTNYVHGDTCVLSGLTPKLKNMLRRNERSYKLMFNNNDRVSYIAKRNQRIYQFFIVTLM